MFDRIISIDWSGAGSEDERVDLRVAVWDMWGCRIQLPSDQSKTRSWKRRECRTWLTHALAEKRRTLVAMDFGFSLPWGADREVFKVNGWRDLTRAVASIYQQAGTARAAAQEINGSPHLHGHGPYRFDDNRTDFRFYLDRRVGYYRLTELAAPQAISQWYLGSGGTVGFHTITGLSALDHLLGLRDEGKLRFAVWPFEPVGESHVLVESYPALCPKCNDDATCHGDDERDAWRVLKHLVNANDHGWLTKWFSIPDLPFGRIEGVSLLDQIGFEGLIFGMVQAPKFVPDPALVAEHHDWLRSFDSGHRAKWDRLLASDPEAALCEAMFRRSLQQNGCEVEPSETLDGAEQRPDFRCTKNDETFYVEVTCISIATAVMQTGIPASEEEITSTISTGSRGLIDAIWRAAKGKAKQVGGLDAPSIVAVGTFHQRASEVCLTDTDMAMALTGHWQVFIERDQDTGEFAEAPSVESSLESAAFLRRGMEGTATARSSISAMLVAGFGAQVPNIKGILHPQASRPFDHTILPRIPFCRLQNGQQCGSLTTEWVNR